MPSWFASEWKLARDREFGPAVFYHGLAPLGKNLKIYEFFKKLKIYYD
jgi:hypothetical protein